MYSRSSTAAVTSEIVCTSEPVPRAAANAVGTPSPMTASASMEEFIPATRRSNDWVPWRTPPTTNDAPSTSSVLPRIEPVIEAVATSSCPARMAKIVMISSAALPKVAFSTPPILGPLLSASCSVDMPTIQASVSSASPEARNTAVLGADARSIATASALQPAAATTEAVSNRFGRRVAVAPVTGRLLLERAHAAELGPATGAALRRRDGGDHLELQLDGVPEQLRGPVAVAVGAARRLGHDQVDDAEGEAGLRRGAQRGGGPLGLAGVLPQDRGAALGRDDRVDGVLLHQHAVGDADRERAARRPLADDAGDHRHRHAHQGELGAGDGAGLAALLGPHARGCAGGVDQRHDREPEPAREAEDAHGLAVALRAGHAEVAVGALLEVAALLVADERDRLAPERADPGHDGRVVALRPVAVKLDEVVADPLQVVQRVGPVLVAGELHRMPGVALPAAAAEEAEPFPLSRRHPA